MLTRMTRRWLPALAMLIAPGLALAADPFELRISPLQEGATQEAKPAAAPGQPAPAPAEGEGEAPAAEEKPEAPAEADGVAHVGKCGAAGCGPAGCRTGGCRSGACSGAVRGMLCGGCNGRGCSGCNGRGMVGGCQPGCQSHFGGPCTCGMVNAMCDNPFLCGRPYTLGDLKCDLHHWKCNVNHELFGDNVRSNAWWAGEVMKYRSRRRYRNAVLNAHLHNKLNYFIPSGGNGKGVPLYGSYARVYAVQPEYFDQRDGQVYASPHTGVPTVIPIAPNVRHQYNYSWGIPSSRITPIYNVMQPSRK